MSTLDTSADARARLKVDAPRPDEQNLLAWTGDPNDAGDTKSGTLSVYLSQGVV